ncbi:MAG TPA: TonB-dependent receptor, partial [Chitinophagaceae bacterium]|nr:TonB-dependent receptor [Chitinophagaceae bacterium]
MKKILFILFVFNTYFSFAQNNFTAIVQDKQTKETLKGVTVTLAGNKKRTAFTDTSGTVVIANIAAGKAVIQFSYVGYKTETLSITIPDTSTHYVLMEPDENALHNVTVIASTRSNENIETATTKVEVLGIEEMNEESTIKPGNIASILGDYSGIQIQQSSATSGNSNVRIQGLDGKYTQILRDGFPLYEGYSGGFGILTIPPLDLKQIELIKGAASTLYGGGAIGGLINLVSKKPSYSPDASFLINQTTLKETNINTWYAQRWKHAGFTMFAGQNFQKQVDVNKDGLSDVPNVKATLIHPSLFIYPSNKSFISLSWSGSFEKRLGGDMIAIENKSNAAHPYFEQNKLDRNTFIFSAENRFSSKITGTLKASYSSFTRDETTNTYFFSAEQNNFYSEASLSAHTTRHTIVGGINITGDDFKPSSKTPVPVGKFSNTTSGIFLQDTWRFLESTKLETGLRYDHHIDYGDFILPRIALFHHFNEQWGTRLGFGMGYKTPNPLAPQIKDYNIYIIKPIAENVTAEKSYGANAEVNYKKEFGEGKTFFINHAFFITSVQHPIIAVEDADGNVSFENEKKDIVTKGFDTYVQAELNAWEFYLGYTFTDARRKYLSQKNFVLFTPQNRAAAVIAYTIEGKWRFGIEASYTGYQRREDYTKTPGYLFVAAMMEKKFGPHWSLVVNCENLLDERQSKYESLYT